MVAIASAMEGTDNESEAGAKFLPVALHKPPVPTLYPPLGVCFAPDPCWEESAALGDTV
jgi:hypothetical protein